MRIDLTPLQEAWLTAEIAAGNFASPEEAISHAINEAKGAALRATLSASIAGGGDHSAEDVLRHVNAHLDARDRTKKAK